MQDINVIKNIYLEKYPEDGLTDNEVKNIEENLHVELPNDFKLISTFFSGGDIGIIDFYDMKRNNPINIIDETIRLRQTINLPSNYIILAEPDESIVVLDVDNIPAVIWCDANDVENLNNKKFSNNPEVWSCYSDMIFDMLNDEV